MSVCAFEQLSSCLTAIIKTEKEAEVRRAAVHVITLLLRGLSDKTTQVLIHTLITEYARNPYAIVHCFTSYLRYYRNFNYQILTKYALWQSHSVPFKFSQRSNYFTDFSFDTKVWLNHSKNIPKALVLPILPVRYKVRTFPFFSTKRNNWWFWKLNSW